MHSVFPRPAIVLPALAAGLLALAGCEVDSASRRIEVRPDGATLKYHESVTLTAYNGYEYDWSLSDNAIGALNTRRGPMVTYTSLNDPASPVVQVVTVTSTFSDNYDPNTNTETNAPVTHTAEAYITHIPIETNDTAGGATD